MTYRTFSLIPTLSNHLMSDRFTQMDNLFSRLTGEKPIAFSPSYNLLQKDKDNYEMVLSVPGYTQDELDISVLNNQLNISSKLKIEETNTNEKKDNIKWLHHGIKKSEFSLNFSLEHRITIQKANLYNGFLTIQFTYNIPEQEKPQKITIDVQNKSSCALEHHMS
ncbi:MAG: Hsp20 family protein [Arsenophonus sp.]